jgi:hypothetical protein
MKWVIMGYHNGVSEKIDSTIGVENADKLVDKYKNDFGSGWVIWAEIKG